MKQPAVARLEAGRMNPTLDTLVRISGALGVSFVIGIGPPTTDLAPGTVERAKRAKPSEARLSVSTD